MTGLTKELMTASENREGPVVFTTVVEQGTLNSIYANCVSKYDEETLVVANNFFDKSRKNILSGSKGLLLFIIKGCRSYQIKGKLNTPLKERFLMT
jgi:hypothetical protein